MIPALAAAVAAPAPTPAPVAPAAPVAPTPKPIVAGPGEVIQSGGLTGQASVQKAGTIPSGLGFTDGDRETLQENNRLLKALVGRG